MKTEEKPPAKSLVDSWISTATAGLILPARQRIASEIKEHFESSVDAHISEGNSRPVAEVMAYSDLGDQFEAAEKFHKKHLTEEELSTLRKNLRPLNYLEIVVSASVFFTLIRSFACLLNIGMVKSTLGLPALVYLCVFLGSLLTFLGFIYSIWSLYRSGAFNSRSGRLLFLRSFLRSLTTSLPCRVILFFILGVWWMSWYASTKDKTSQLMICGMGCNILNIAIGLSFSLFRKLYNSFADIDFVQAQ